MFAETVKKMKCDLNRVCQTGSFCCSALGIETEPSDVAAATDSAKTASKEPTVKYTMYDDMCNQFKLPIDYLEESKQIALSTIVANDLEFEVIDPSGGATPMYNYLFDPKDEFSKIIAGKWHKKYTADIPFLTDTQTVIVNMKEFVPVPSTSEPPISEKLEKIWKTVKNNPNFLEIYSYMEWNQLEFLNHSSFFLQAVSLANISAPILALIIPVLFLLVPFLILKIQGIPITFQSYLTILHDIAKHHFMGKAIISLQNMSIQNILYFVAMSGLYFYQIYQNTMACIRFYNNVSEINESLYTIKQYVNTSIQNMEQFLAIQKNGQQMGAEYCAFFKDIVKQIDILKSFAKKLENIQKFQPSIYKIGEVGYLLECFYSLYHDKNYESALRFSFGFTGYLSNVQQVYWKYHSGFIGRTNYLKEPLEIREPGKVDASGNQTEDIVTHTSLSIVQQYYPPYVCREHVKNDCVFDKNMVITGPNAAGKTTIIKTTLINLIMSQQVGFGCFGECHIQPYSHIHSYLNIPDTSGRDSLFQAESRRCRDILDEIEKDTVGRHFCIFDELYSGTNPVEAVKSAGSFLKYLTTYANVDFILTTHYTKLCKKLKTSNNRVQNYKMDAIVVDDQITYTYQLKPGISYIEGAKFILKEMNYPKEIYGDESNR